MSENARATRQRPYMALNKEELDHQLSPSRSAKDASGVLASWKVKSQEARNDPRILAYLDLPYGKRASQKLDIFTHKLGHNTGPRPIHVFIHGGFWQEGSKDLFDFPAPAFIAAGWIYVAVGYTLAPAATLTAIVTEIRQALKFVHLRARDFDGDPDRIVVSGHSAGGHLAACLLATPSSVEHVPPIAGIVSISGVFDLAPIRASYINDAVGLTDDEVAEFSPIHHRPAHDIPTTLVVAAGETAEFLRQTDVLAAAWGPHLTDIRVETIPGKDHFDILFGLADPSSELFRLVTRQPTITDREPLL